MCNGTYVTYDYLRCTNIPACPSSFSSLSLSVYPSYYMYSSMDDYKTKLDRCYTIDEANPNLFLNVSRLNTPGLRPFNRDTATQPPCGGSDTPVTPYQFTNYGSLNFDLRGLVPFDVDSVTIIGMRWNPAINTGKNISYPLDMYDTTRNLVSSINAKGYVFPEPEGTMQFQTQFDGDTYYQCLDYKARIRTGCVTFYSGDSSCAERFSTIVAALTINDWSNYTLTTTTGYKVTLGWRGSNVDVVCPRETPNEQNGATLDYGYCERMSTYQCRFDLTKSALSMLFTIGEACPREVGARSGDGPVGPTTPVSSASGNGVSVMVVMMMLTVLVVFAL
eukprot:TRINITY_DN17833_c0_g1_i1.p1 TRINITY_DN17833_c0_g1~~TRINITY_DN17833_c0_g1_i1.p1  ORF type:complete len:334 (-),score=33.29 TRINITY_DN17833_c0_g1_i1:65-1066(-)